MSTASIITNWKNKEFKPVYWLEGDEDFFIDEIMEFAEKKSFQKRMQNLIRPFFMEKMRTGQML